jgi:hypothetical protein
LSPSPPDWYPDPSSASSRIYRWWDGQAWTKQTAVGKPAATEVLPPAPPAPVATSSSYGTAQYSNGDSCMAPSQVLAEAPVEVPVAPSAASRIGSQSLWQRNQSAIITMGIVAVYLVLAVKTHIVMFGVWPFLTSIRSWQRKEPLAGLAVCAAVVAVLVAIIALSGH